MAPPHANGPNLANGVGSPWFVNGLNPAGGVSGRGRFSLVIIAAQPEKIRKQRGARPEGQAPQSVRFVKLSPN